IRELHHADERARLPQDDREDDLRGRVARLALGVPVAELTGTEQPPAVAPAAFRLVPQQPADFLAVVGFGQPQCDSLANHDRAVRHGAGRVLDADATGAGYVGRGRGRLADAGTGITQPLAPARMQQLIYPLIMAGAIPPDGFAEAGGGLHS